MRRKLQYYISTLLFVVAVAPLYGAWSEENKAEPVEVIAEAMDYNQETGVVTATGEVELMQGKRVLHGDSVTYNKKTDIVDAEGAIRFDDDNGDVYYADTLQLRNKMDDGDIVNLRAKLADDSTLWAKSAERKNSSRLLLDDAQYTPCSLCQEDREEARPLWQVRAKKVKMDQEEQRVRYKHAFFDVYGVPVFYTPYFSHATPGADRKSGLLTPRYTNDSSLGNVVELPYYLNLAPDFDATIKPIITGKEGVVMGGEFRHLIERGQYKIRGSITRPDKRDDLGRRIEGKKTRGHIEGEGIFHLENDWTAGFVGKRASDDTYLRRYNFGDEDTLTTRVYAEKLKGRNYTVVQALSFQGLNAEDDPSSTPFILPYSKMHMESAPGYKGSRWLLDTNALILNRSEGSQSRRIALDGGWQLPYTSKSGHVWKFQTGLRGDLYSIDRENAIDPDDNSSFEGRVIPEIELDWSFPLVKENRNSRIIIEPIANIIVSPVGGNTEDIPNEDSQVIELSDDNLFSANRFTGMDRIETGPRMNYGLRGGIHGHNGQHVDFLFGQNYRIKEDTNLASFSGMEDNFSDYVGRVLFSTSEMFDVGYRFRLNKDDMSLSRSEIVAGVYYAPIRVDVDYVSLDAASSTINDSDREELYGRVSYDITREWAVSADARRDLTSDGGFVSSGATLLHRGDCVDFTVSWLREFTRDRDIEPSTAFTFQIQLKNLN